MHWIERHILKQLAFADAIAYSHLLPEAVEGNLFQYHARSLEKRGLIIREKSGYSLTKVGQAFVADLSQTRTMSRRRLPIPMVAALVEAPQTGEWLLFRWKRHPYRGQIGIPMGRHTWGMTIVEAALDQLWWKSSLTGHGRLLGSIELIQTSKPTEVHQHTLIHVVGVEAVSGTMGSDEQTGSSFWAQPDETSDIDWIPGLKHELERLAKQS